MKFELIDLKLIIIDLICEVNPEALTHLLWVIKAPRVALHIDDWRKVFLRYKVTANHTARCKMVQKPVGLRDEQYQYICNSKVLTDI